MKKPHPLDDLEMHELLRLLYPEHIRSDDDAYFELSQQACESIVDLGDGFEVPLPELLARVAMLTMPMQSGLTGALSHCLGEVTIADGAAQMRAAVRRDVANPSSIEGASLEQFVPPARKWQTPLGKTPSPRAGGIFKETPLCEIAAYFGLTLHENDTK